VPGADAASFDRAAQEAERNCPVSRALQGSVEIGVQATLDEHPGSSAVGAA
jgi:osmotically inducible protein OsmC